MTRLIKIGSGLIGPEGRVDHAFLEAKCAEIAELMDAGDRIVVVSSGAVAAGMEVAQRTHRPMETLELQFLAGIGQTRLMKYYRDYFHRFDRQTAQLLLTHYNFATPREERTITHLLLTYLDRGVVPIVNENDLVNKEELEHRGHFTDNDILAALVAERVHVDQALLLTDVAGLMRRKPGSDTVEPDGLIRTVEAVDGGVKAMARGARSREGLGGMYSKVIAAERMTARGIEVIVGNGRLPLATLIGDPAQRTLFRAAGHTAQAAAVEWPLEEAGTPVAAPAAP
jgi:glutamate 5-kinase